MRPAVLSFFGAMALMGASWLMAGFMAGSTTGVAAQGPQIVPWPVFTDVTDQAGITFRHSIGDDELTNIVEGTGAGACVFDFDNDGFVDIYIPNGRWTKGVSDNRGRALIGKLSNVLYHNNGDGTFTDVTRKAGVGGKSYGFSCSTADIDADGTQDLFVLNYGPNELYHNNGDGTFTDITEKSGLGDPSWSLSAPWLDYNADGRPDVFVANYLEYDDGKFRSYYPAAGYPGPLSYNGQQNRLQRNNGDGTFTDVTKETGLINPNGRAMSAASVDLNNDGSPDIYVANDSMESYYYENTGKGSFVEKGRLTGLAFSESGQGVSHMGPSIGDVDRDGRFDIMIPDMNYGSLLMNRGTFFEDAIHSSGLAVICAQSAGWGAALTDFDNDGFLDLFVPLGDAHHEYPQHQIMTRNVGVGRFSDMADLSGSYFKTKWMGRGALYFDFDNDGDLDILAVNLNSAAHLLRNDGGNKINNWLTVDLRLPNGVTPALGARVTVTTADLRQIQEYVGVQGYLVQNDIRAHFGVGQATMVEIVEIRWPDGKLQQIKDVPTGQFLKVVQDAK